jgi:hypothetical protein
LDLAQRKRELWLKKALFSKDDDTYWQDCFGCFVSDEQSGYAKFSTLDEIAERTQAFLSSVDEVLLGPDSPICEAQGPIGLIRWDRSIQFRQQGKLIPGPTRLCIAVRRNGQWKEAVGIAGDWPLGPSERVESNNEDHLALEHLLDKQEAIARSDVRELSSLMHSDCLCILPDPLQPHKAVISGRDKSVDYEETTSKVAFDKYEFTVSGLTGSSALPDV